MRSMKISKALMVSTILILPMLSTGCDDKPATQNPGKTSTKTPNATGSQSLPDLLFASAAPSGEPATIVKLKNSAKEGDKVSVRVVVGGREKPFASNMAVMTVVDAGMKNQCLSPDDTCTTPWDYCCEGPAELKKNMATVQFVDKDGKPLKVDLNGDARVKPLTTLLVVGTVGPRPSNETLVINATEVFVQPAESKAKPAPDTKLPEADKK